MLDDPILTARSAYSHVVNERAVYAMIALRRALQPLTNIGVVKLLVCTYSCDTTIANDEGKFPLHYAVAVGHLEGARILSCGMSSASLNVSDHYGYTPRITDVTKGYLEFVQYLLAQPNNFTFVRS